jgi:hypothetical protein
MDFLDVVLFEVRQDEQQPIIWCRKWTIGIGNRTIAFSDIAIERRLAEIVLHAAGEMR